MINGILAEAILTLGPVSLQTPPMIIFPVPEYIIVTDTFRSWQNSHSYSLSCGVGAIVIEKAKWKSSELSLTKKILNQKQYHIPGGITEFSAAIKDLKDAGMKVPARSLFNSSVWTVPEDKWIREKDR